MISYDEDGDYDEDDTDVNYDVFDGHDDVLTKIMKVMLMIQPLN